MEGCKQPLSVRSNTATGSIYSVDGCRNWSTGGVPTADLRVAQHKDVVIIFDGDISTNPAVWMAAERLGAALAPWRPKSVRYALVPTGSSAGVDDLLGALQEAERADYLAVLIDDAKGKLGGHGGIAKPKAKRKKGDAAQATTEADSDRSTVVVSEDRWLVIQELSSALVSRWDRERLFNFGGVISQRKKASMKPLDSGSFPHVLAETCCCVTQVRDGEVRDSWPDNYTMKAVLNHAEPFAVLDRGVIQVPFIRPDGSVCQSVGYDQPTRTYLSAGVSGVVVPDEPTGAEVRSAVSLIVDELLEGFCFKEQADRANAIGFLLTPYIRGLVDLALMAVIDGKQAGSGKGKLANAVAIVTTGRAANLLPWNAEDAENRKVITSAFESGTELMVFDEAHTLAGPSLARALTAPTYTDRIPGDPERRMAKPGDLGGAG